MNIIIGLWTAWAVMSLVVLSNQGKVAAANFSAPSFIAMLIVTGIYFSIRAITKKTNRSLGKTQQSQFNSGINDAQLDEIYEQIALEMKEGRIKEGVMARALAESDGNKNKAEATYIKLRVRALTKEAEEVKMERTLNSGKSVEDDLLDKSVRLGMRLELSTGEVLSVTDGYAASKAGLLQGDIVKKVNDAKVGVETVNVAMYLKEQDCSALILDVVRDGQEMEITIPLNRDLPVQHEQEQTIESKPQQEHGQSLSLEDQRKLAQIMKQTTKQKNQKLTPGAIFLIVFFAGGTALAIAMEIAGLIAN